MCGIFYFSRKHLLPECADMKYYNGAGFRARPHARVLALALLSAAISIALATATPEPLEFIDAPIMELQHFDLQQLQVGMHGAV